MLKARRFVRLLALTNLAVLAALLGACKPRSQVSAALTEGEVKTSNDAFDVWTTLWESSSTGKSIPILVHGTKAPITFGAEKEGSSGVVTRLTGPTARDFGEYVERHANIRQFLIDFMTNWASGKYRESSVKTAAGEDVSINPVPFQNVDYEALSTDALRAKFKEWLASTRESPFSFMTKAYRKALYDGEAFGQRLPLNPQELPPTQQIMRFHKWKPLFGVPERYIGSITTDEGGIWELQFVPQKTYGEFETMIQWFRAELGTEVAGALEKFDAPGHQRLVFANPANTPQSKLDKLKEVMRLGQAYIILREMAGETGIDVSKHKVVFPDKAIEEWKDGRGVIRLEDNRFKIPGSRVKTASLEQRAGTKTDRTRRNVQFWVVTYTATNDFGEIASIQDWQLMSAGPRLGNTAHTDATTLAERFDLDRAVCERAVELIRSTKGEFGDDIRNIKKGFEVPLWFWENAPFLQGKTGLLKSVTRDFIVSVAKTDGSFEAIRGLMAQWVRGTEVFRDIETYLTPKPRITRESLAHLPRTAKTIDINKINLGIEYSAHFPIDTEATYSNDYFRGSKDWIRTNIDLSPEERVEVLRRMAEALATRVGGTIVKEQTGGGQTTGEHGHGLDIYFKIQDGQGRSWRVEWDGIGRSYKGDGSVDANSLRGGHIEVVTPKFVPTQADIDAVFGAFEAVGLNPHKEAGGGHINIDLKPFEGQPAALARFISIFLQHRGIMSFMFQRENRLKSAEPFDVSPEVVAKLANWQGSELELQQFLYENRFFNSRLGRKTKYVQLELSGFFQDIIPDKFVSKDFDIRNPKVPWRQTFPVDPDIRKLEFRMFDAPRNAAEAALQIRFVRAMLHMTFNDNSALSGAAQEVNHKAYAYEAHRLEADFDRMMKFLGLERDMYRYLIHENAVEHRRLFESELYQTFEQRIAENPRAGEWETPRTTPRSRSERLADRPAEVAGVPILKEAKVDQKSRLARAEEMERRRKYAPGKNDCGILRRAFLDGVSIFERGPDHGLFEVLDVLERGPVFHVAA